MSTASRMILFAMAFALPVLADFPLPSVIASGGPEGSVDWVKGYVQGVGYGTAKPSGNRVKDRMMAVRAAEVTAQRSLAEAIDGVRIDGATVMRDAVRQYVLESRVQGVIRGARKVKEEVGWDGDTPSATVVLRVFLAAGAAKGQPTTSLMDILAGQRKREPDHVPAEEYDIGESSEFPARSAKVSYDTSRPVSGLLLRIEGARFERELFPVVVTRVGGGKLQAVFSAKNVKPDVVRMHGVCRYADTPEQAKKSPLLGDNPLVVAVTEVTKENMIVVNADGAKAIRETTRYGNDFLAEAKVVIAGK